MSSSDWSRKRAKEEDGESSVSVQEDDGRAPSSPAESAVAEVDGVSGTLPESTIATTAAATAPQQNHHHHHPQSQYQQPPLPQHQQQHGEPQQHHQEQKPLPPPPQQQQQQQQNQQQQQQQPSHHQQQPQQQQQQASSAQPSPNRYPPSHDPRVHPPPHHPTPPGYYPPPPVYTPGSEVNPYSAPPRGYEGPPFMPPHGIPHYPYPPMYPPYPPMYPHYHPPHHPYYPHSPMHQDPSSQQPPHQQQQPPPPHHQQPPQAPAPVPPAPAQPQEQQPPPYASGGPSTITVPPPASYPPPQAVPPTPLPADAAPGRAGSDADTIEDQKPPARNHETVAASSTASTSTAVSNDGSMDPAAAAASAQYPQQHPHPIAPLHHPHHHHPHSHHQPPLHTHPGSMVNHAAAPSVAAAPGGAAAAAGSASGVMGGVAVPGDEKDSEIVPGAVTARLKTYIKPRIPSTQEVLDRRSRKNAQSRARAAKLRERICEIELKNATDRTEEEMVIFQQYENRRQRKNDRSRERALEKKEEIDRILAKPEKKRTKIEKQFLETALSAKKRKNEGDRLRRQRLKDLGLSTKGTSGVKPGISARGPLPARYQQDVSAGAASTATGVTPTGATGGHHFSDIPMSPLPTVPPHHHVVQSPGGFASPGMIANITFPSPSQSRRIGGASHGGTQSQMLPFIPPSQTYDGQTSPASRGQVHLSQHSSRVEQRRNPDGSMSISIGGRGAGGPSFGGEARLQGAEEQSSVNISDVSHLLLYSDNGEGEEAGERQESEEKIH